MVITLDWTTLQIALVITIALIGLGLGWKYMAIWTIGMFFAALASDAVAPRLERIINRILGIGTSILSDFTSDPNAPAPTTVTPARNIINIPSPDLPLWQMGFLLLAALPVAMFVARSYGNRVNVGFLGKITGGIFGALGGIILLAKVTDYWRTWVSAPGHSDPLAAFNLQFAPTIPTFVFGGASTTFNWQSLAGIAIILALALLIFYALYRVIRIVF